MRNLKKLFAVILVVAMMASFMIPAFAAPSDVVGSDIEDEVARLVALGIITGREDGKFYPAETITRAEFAAVVIRALGYGSAADAAKGQTKFSDVKADFWASGYINLASSLGIIKGRPDGTFGANDKVLYEEAVTMIVRSLGYEPAASANGGYPTGYLAIASQEDIDEDAVAAVGSPASRGLVAKLVDNSLEVAMMVQTGYGTEQKYVKSGTEGTAKQTILDSKLKLDVREATVDSINADKNEIKVHMLPAGNGDGQSDKNEKDAGLTKTYKVFAGLSFIGLENASVTIWKKDDVIYNIESDTVVYYDYITKLNNEDDESDINKPLDEITTITLQNAGTFDTAENGSGDISYTVIKNGQDNVDETAANTDDVLLTGEVFAKVYVEDGAITRIEAVGVNDANIGIIKSVATSSITMVKGTDDSAKLSNLGDYDNVYVYIDGVAKKLADLKEDMVMQWATVSNDYNGDDNIYLVASTKKVEGTLTANKVDRVTVGGTNTSMYGAGVAYFSKDGGDTYAATVDVDSLKDFIGENIIGYVTYRGKIAYVKGSVETSDFYGILEGANKFNKEIKVASVVDKDMDTLTYDTDLTTAQWNALIATLAADGSTVANTYTDRATRVFKFAVDKDNVITSAAAVALTAVNPALFNKDADYIKDAGNTDKIYTDGAKIFSIDSNEDIDNLNWTDIEGTTLTAGMALAAYYVTGDNTPDVIFLADTGAQDIIFTTSDIYLGWVTSKQRLNKDEYEMVANTGAGSKTFTVDNDYAGNFAEKKLAKYTLTGETGAKVSVSSAAYSQAAGLDLTALAGGNFETTDVNATVVLNGITGNKIKVTGSMAADVDYALAAGGTTFALASDAVVYKIEVDSDGGTNYVVSDLSEIAEDGNALVSFVTYKGNIKYLFFYEAVGD